MDENGPILMSMPGRLKFTADGKWLHDDVLVSNPKIALYFSRHLKFSPDHESYVVEVEGKCVKVEVEDTPVVVKSVRLEDELPAALLLGDGTEQAFSPARILVGVNDVLYCRLADDRIARLLRPAMQALLPFITSENKQFFISISGQSQPIMRREEVV
ncbi:MAG: hypothetical protein KDD66_11190 [Bdellovibrionales bacterium]|nr:hypothetical protein [Bdellovibrionales bacterium]